MLCNICDKDHIVLEKHHIQSKCYGGEDHLYNISELCSYCHKLVHYGIYVIEGWFGSTNGRILIWRKFYKDSITGTENKVWLTKNHEYIQEKYLKRKKGNDLNKKD